MERTDAQAGVLDNSSSSSWELGLAVAPIWQKGIVYLRRGTKIVFRNPGLYASLAFLYSIPAVVSGLIGIGLFSQFPSSEVIGTVFLAVTISFAPVVVMEAAAKGHERKKASFLEVTKGALPWFTRYLWTNFHTSLIFWMPIQILFFLERKTQGLVPLSGNANFFFIATWATLILAAALYLHTRTVLAPYLAIHSDLPGTLATVASWRISGRYFWETLSVFLAGTLPVALPVLGTWFTILMIGGWLGHPIFSQSLVLASLVAILAQLSRPLLIPAIHALYIDLWRAETRRSGKPSPSSLPWSLQGIYHGSEILSSKIKSIPRFGSYLRL